MRCGRSVLEEGIELNSLDSVLWLTGFAEHVILLVILVAFKRAKVFPAFTALMASNVVRTSTLFFVNRHLGAYAYYYTYLVFAAVDICLEIGVAYEIALHVFRPAGRWFPGARTTFAWFITVAALFAGGMTWLALPPTSFLSDTLLVRGNFFSAALMSEFFIGMLLLSAKLMMPWRTHVARLALGFGCYSILCVAIEAFHTYVGLDTHTPAYRIVARVRGVTYAVIALYWIVSLSRSAPPERQMPTELQSQLLALQKHASSWLTVLRGGRNIA